MQSYDLSRDALENVDREASTFWWDANQSENFYIDRDHMYTLVDREASTFFMGGLGWSEPCGMPRRLIGTT